MRVWSLIATIVLGSFAGSLVAQEAQPAAAGQAAALRRPTSRCHRHGLSTQEPPHHEG